MMMMNMCMVGDDMMYVMMMRMIWLNDHGHDDVLFCFGGMLRQVTGFFAILRVLPQE